MEGAEGGEEWVKNQKRSGSNNLFMESNQIGYIFVSL